MTVGGRSRRVLVAEQSAQLVEVGEGMPKMSSPMLEYAFFEGRIVPFAEAKISVGTHAVQYGTGAFAGIRGYLDDDGETINIFRLPDHAARLLDSAKLLRARLLFTRESLAQTIAALVEKNAPGKDVYIRP